MKVIVTETGDRPAVLTNARRFAPQGVKVLGELLERFMFADLAFVTLDWSNSLGMQNEDFSMPIVVIDTHKQVGEKWLSVQVRLDVEDVFGKNEITAANMIDVIADMERKTLEELERNRNGL